MRLKKRSVVFGMLLVILLSACNRESRWQKQYDLGIQYLTEGKYEEAIVAFNVAIEIEPNQVLAYIGRGSAYISSGETEENLNAALADYQKAIELDAQNADAYFGVADVYVRQGEYEAALEILKNDLGEIGDGERVIRMISEIGMQYLTEGKHEKAIAAFSTAIEIDSRALEAYLGRAAAYLGSGETEENLAAAQADYERVIALDEMNADGYLGLADVLIRMGEYDRAQEVLRDGLEATDNEQIREKLEEIESGMIVDESGKVRRRSFYDGNGILGSYVEYTYDAEGRQNSATSYDAGGMQTGHVDCVYDERGLEIQGFYGVLSDVNHYEVRMQRSEYDDQGRRTRTEQYEKDGTSSGFFAYSYDTDGNMAEETFYEKEGRISFRYEFDYNEKCRITEERHYLNHNGELRLEETVIYEYDEQWRLVRRENYDTQNRLLEYTIWEYDGEKTISREYEADGTLRRSVEG